MLAAVFSRLTALDIEEWCRRAGRVPAFFAVDVDHTLLGMMLAVYRSKASEVERRRRRACVVGAVLCDNIHHAGHAMLPTVRRHLPFLEVEGGSLHAWGVFAPFYVNVEHAILSVPLTVQRRLAAFGVIKCP